MIQPIFHSFSFLLTAVLLLAAAAWWSAPVKKGKRPWGWILWRWLTILLLAFILARPSWTKIETETFPGNVFILTDTSQSMGVSDETVDGKDTAVSRFAAMRSALDSSADEFKKMAQNVRTEVFGFDETLHHLSIQSNGKISLPDQPSGTETALGNSLLEMLQKSSGRKVLGVVLLSDGAQRSVPPRDALPQTAIRRMNQLGIPLYSVCFGSASREMQTKDAVVEDFLADQRVFTDTEAAVSGRIRLDGLTGQEVPVELLVENAAGEMEIAAQTTVRSEVPGEILPVLLSWHPKEPGEVKVSLRVPPQTDEVSFSNNQMDAYVTVAKSGLRVLCLESAFRPETAFLRRSLDSAEEIRLDLIRLTPQGSGFSQKRLDLTRILREEYAAIILGDVSANCFTPEELKLLAEKVAGGTGLLTLGGLQNYQNGAYAGTPLAQILPVLLTPTPNGTSRPTGKDSSETQWNLPLQMKLTPAGKRHPALALDSNPALSEQIWSKFPPLDGANRFFGWKSGAVILASDFTPENEEIPLLLEQTFGRGRIMTLAADSTWRWQMAGFEEQHKRFWRQLVFWLANKESTLDGTVSLILPQRRFPQEKAIHFQLSARLSSGEPLTPPTAQTQTENWTAFLETPDKKQIPIPMTPAQNLMTGEIPADLPVGEFMLYASVTHQGQKIGESRCRFQIFHHDLEMDRAQAEPELMAALAISAGGEAVTPEELPNLWKRLAENREELKIERKLEIPVWDRWWFLVLILAMLTAEWIWRKTKGAV